MAGPGLTTVVLCPCIEQLRQFLRPASLSLRSKELVKLQVLAPQLLRVFVRSRSSLHGVYLETRAHGLPAHPQAGRARLRLVPLVG